MRVSATTVSIRWCAEAHGTQGEYSLIDAPQSLAFDLPLDRGRARMNKVYLGDGVGLGRAAYSLSRAPRSELKERLRFVAKVNEPFLSVQHWVRGRGAYEETLDEGPGRQIPFSAGTSIFRLNRVWDASLSTKPGENAENVSLVMPLRTLRGMLGSEHTENLLRRLGLGAEGAAVATRLPPRVIHPLIRSLTSTYEGYVGALMGTARLHEFLAELLCQNPDDAREKRSSLLRYRKRLHELHDSLVDLEGPIPSLDALGRQFGLSSRRLSALFREEFGQSLVRHISERRLDAAHTQLLRSEVSVKALAARYGYAHASHFVYAFKRKFGYSPGSLRKA